MSAPPFVKEHALSGVTALLFGLTIWRLGMSPELPAVLAFVFGGVLLAAIDWKARLLPRKIVYMTAAAVAGALAAAALITWDWAPLLTAAIGAVAFANVFFLTWFLGKKMLGMLILGYGDVRLALVLGMITGWYGLEYVVYGAVAGIAFALVLGIALIIKERRFHLQFCFGPPLIAGALAVVLFHG